MSQKLSLSCAPAFAALFWMLASTNSLSQIRDGDIDPRNLGRGEWLYFMSSATNHLGGRVPAVTNEASLMLYLRSQQIRYIIVKAASSDQLFKGSYSFPQFTRNLVDTAHAHGLLIFGYNRSFGANIAGEIAISDYVFQQGADGFVWDAEAEWESHRRWIGNEGPAKAWHLCSTVRSNWPNKFLAHAPFAIINFHSSFPYKEFGYWCDAVMPQNYHFSSTGMKRSVSAAINWMDVNFADYHARWASLPPTNIGGLTVYWTNAIKPIVPIQDVYGPPYSSPTPDRDVMEFIDYLSADPHAQAFGGYRGVNFFRADLHDAAQWAYIKTGTIGIVPGSVNNIVLDNPNTTVVGAWTPVRTFYTEGNNKPMFQGNGSGADTNSFGTNYLAKGRGDGSAYVQYTPRIITAGHYDVYQWHAHRADASASVPFAITCSSGTTTVFANQRTNAGFWSLLGRFHFNTGISGNIRVTDAIAETNGVALVDGLKLVYAGDSGAPGITEQPGDPSGPPPDRGP